MIEKIGNRLCSLEVSVTGHNGFAVLFSLVGNNLIMDIAIANAKRLDKQNEGRKPSESAPGTKVYELVEMLRPYLLDTQ